MVGFVAKEAVISSWAQTYAMAEPTDLHDPGALGEAVQADFAQSPAATPTAAVWAFMVFLLAYTPCVATLAAQRREIGLRWTLFGVAVQLVSRLGGGRGGLPSRTDAVMSAGPLRLVLAAVDDGALTVAEIHGHTGLSTDMIRSSLEHLERMGQLSAEPIAVGCPPAGCGTCATACATGPVLVGLSPVRRAS